MKPVTGKLNPLTVHAHETKLVRLELLLRFISICATHPFRLLLCVAAIWPSAARSDLFFSDEQIADVVNAARSGRCDVTCSLGESRFSKYTAERISGPHGAQHWHVYLIKAGSCGSAGCGSTLITFNDTEVRVVDNAFSLDPDAVQMPDFSSPETIAKLQRIPISPSQLTPGTERVAGPWQYKKTPDFKLNPGEKKGSIYVAQDGAVTVGGKLIFPAVRDTYVSVSLQQDGNLALVTQNDIDYGGIQAALIDTSRGEVLYQNLVEDPSGLRKYIKYDSAWSPDKRYVGLVSGPNEVPDLAILNLDTGAVDYFRPDFVSDWKGRGILLKSMVTLDDGRIAVEFVEKYCYQGCRGPETAFHNPIPPSQQNARTTVSISPKNINVNQPTEDDLGFRLNVDEAGVKKTQKLCPLPFICSEEARLAIGAVLVLSLKAENEFTRGNLCEAATFAAARKAAGNLFLRSAYSTLFSSLLYESVSALFAPFTFETKVLIGGASKLALGLVVDSTFGVLDYNDIPKDTFKILTSGTIGYMAPKLTEKYVDQKLAALAITEATKDLSDNLLDSLLNQEKIVRVNAEANNTGVATPSVDAKVGLIYNEETHYVSMLVRSVGRNRQECGEKLYVLKYEIDDDASPVTSVEVPHEELPVR